MVKSFVKCMLFVLSVAAIPHVSQGQSSEPTPRATAHDQRLRDAQTAKEEAEAAYYREQIARLRELPKPKTLWQSIEDNPASALGVLGVIVTALVGLFTLYKNQRLTIETQYDTQFYEALKRFGDKDSARLRSSAVGLLTDMASRGFHKNRLRPFSPDNNATSKYFTVLGQLVAGSRLEEHRVVLNSIKAAMELLAKHEPISVMEALYRANLNLQRDLKDAMQTFSFHFRELNVPQMNEVDQDIRPRISPEIWRPSEQVTGFSSYSLYDWFACVTNNFRDYDQSALAEVETMTTEEKARHKQDAIARLKTVSNQLKQNVEVCCSTLLRLATVLSKAEPKASGTTISNDAGDDTSDYSKDKGDVRVGTRWHILDTWSIAGPGGFSILWQRAQVTRCLLA